MLLVFSVLFCCICVLGWDCRDYIPPSNKATFVKKRGDLPGFHIKKPAPCVLEEGCWLNGTMGGYLTNDEVEERFFALNCLYPSLLSSNVSIGTTRQDRHIYRYVLGGHGHETASILLVGMLHARDVTALSTILFAVEQLCRLYGHDRNVTSMLDSVALHIVPVVNVDRFVLDQADHPHGGGESVRNARSSLSITDHPQLKDFTCGAVNLDRNFPTFWGSAIASHDQCKEQYSGPTSASEPETRALLQTIDTFQFSNALLVHSLAGLHEHSQLLYPWFYIHATHELAPSVNRKHVRLARRVRTGLRNQMSIDLGEGSRSDFSGDGTLADHLCEHGATVLMLAVGVGGQVSAGAPHWPPKAYTAETAKKLFPGVREWLVAAGSDALTTAESRGIVSSEYRWLRLQLEKSDFAGAPNVLLALSLLLCVAVLCGMCYTRCASKETRATTSQQLRDMKPSTPLHEPATLGQVLEFKKR